MASPKVGRTIFLLSQCTHTSSVCCMVLLGTSPMSCLLNFRGSLFFFQAWPLDLPTGLRSGILIPTPPWMSWHPIAYYIQGISTSSKVKEVPRFGHGIRKELLRRGDPRFHPCYPAWRVTSLPKFRFRQTPDLNVTSKYFRQVGCKFCVGSLKLSIVNWIISITYIMYVNAIGEPLDFFLYF